MASESNQSQRLQNLYVARLVTQERPCFVCGKFTSVVLTSADNSNADWFYVCRSHLGDFNFCSKLGGSPKPVQTKARKELQANRPPPESDSIVDLVSNIGSAWKSWRQGSNNTSNKSQDDDNDEGKKKEHDNNNNNKDQDEKSKEDEDNKQSSPTPSGSSNSNTPSSPLSSASPALPLQQQQPVRFVIQRDYFYLRQREYKNKIDKKEASEKLKTLHFPEVPKSKPTI
ncbi:hypothetical protein [Parasitella parasitica]|uniref:VPS4-associated protein 1 n=1 Tax=Parasitella parasitica TaxID=35722 RepID=A0A0B7N4U8_9FUNG|nr:hypothetical protein [Parasitella parasitica]